MIHLTKRRRAKNNRLGGLLAGLSILWLVIIACSTDSNPIPVKAPSTPVLRSLPTFDSTTSTSLPATAVPTPSATPVPDRVPPSGILRIAVSEPPAHLDVHQEASPALMTWGPGLAYDRLLRFDSRVEGGGPHGAVVCLMCESWEMLDSTTYRVTLRSGIQWQDLPPVNGRPVVANDVVFSLERQATSGWSNAGLISNIRTVSAVNSRTVQFSLERPDAEFLEILADSHSVIVPPELVQDADLLNGPVVGSGPWIWDGTNESRTVFSANPDYFDPIRPGVKTLEIAYISPGTQFSSLLTGVIDFARLEPNEYAAAVDRNPDLQRVDVLQSGTGLELALNTGTAVFGSVEARKSLFGALRPWQALDEVWGGDAFVSVGLPIMNPRWMPEPSEMRSIFDGFSGGSAAALNTDLPIVIKVGLFDDRFLEHARSVADALVERGAEATIEEVTTREFANDVWFGGNFDLFIGSQPPVASLSDYLLSVYHSQGAWNTTGYSSPVLDNLIESQAVESDPLRRQGLIVEIQRQILDGAHRFAPASRVERWLAWPVVGNFNPATPRGDGSFLSEIRLDGARTGRR